MKPGVRAKAHAAQVFKLLTFNYVEDDDEMFRRALTTYNLWARGAGAVCRQQQLQLRTALCFCAAAYHLLCACPGRLRATIWGSLLAAQQDKCTCPASLADETCPRFRYTPEFLRWALQPPGFMPQWHIGVRARKSHLLVGFITGVPARCPTPGHLTPGRSLSCGLLQPGSPACMLAGMGMLGLARLPPPPPPACRPRASCSPRQGRACAACRVRVNGSPLQLAEINFLCVHKKLRSKRLAPLLIRVAPS